MCSGMLRSLLFVISLLYDASASQCVFVFVRHTLCCQACGEATVMEARLELIVQGIQLEWTNCSEPESLNLACMRQGVNDGMHERFRSGFYQYISEPTNYCRQYKLLCSEMLVDYRHQAAVNTSRLSQNEVLQILRMEECVARCRPWLAQTRTKRQTILPSAALLQAQEHPPLLSQTLATSTTVSAIMSPSLSIQSLSWQLGKRRLLSMTASGYTEDDTVVGIWYTTIHYYAQFHIHKWVCAHL